MNDYEKEHLELLRKHLAECTVLLKKDGSFPLAKPCEIAAYGSGVRHTAKGGTGSGEVNSRFYVNVEQGLENAGFTVTSKTWLDAYERLDEKAKKHHLMNLRSDARANKTLAVIEGMGKPIHEPEYYIPLNAKGDTAVYVVRRISGEGSDRTEEDLHLSQTEIRDILSINYQYKNFMLVINAGGYLDLSPVAHVKNILILSQLGVETGDVLADILLGKAVPSGKLTKTWASHDDFYAESEFGNADDTRYKEGIYVGYRYYSTIGKKPLYPFGYGLGYTEFSLTPGTFEQKGETIEVLCKVKNTGVYKGKETVQLYVSAPLSKLDQPYCALAAFAKTKELMPEEETEVTLSFMMRDLASYDEQTESYVLFAGDYLMRLGTSVEDTQLIGAFHIEEDIITQKALNSFEKPDFEDLKLPQNEREIPDTVIIIDPSAIKTHTLFPLDERMDPQLLGLEDEELAQANIGAFGGDSLSIIGSAGKQVAGAAGETTSKLKDYGYPQIVMADGPAGLRLSRFYFEDKKGSVHGIGPVLPETISELLPRPVVKGVQRLARKPGKKDTVLEQHATALPIGTAIAQSFNPQFAKLCGDIAGREMERFNIDIWLAPALNIQRDERCGRNFEYFSEDPLVSGIFAAAITKGVQKHTGKGVCVKHYAANNQETNRYNSNSVISERALREIYLRGFEIAIRESHPASLMTSYKLVNGTHASEHKGLLINILRRQFGYEGIVMTDWVTAGFLLSRNAKYPAPDAAKVAAAGNDLFMPGSRKELSEILKGLKNGTVKPKDLLINASRIKRVHDDMMRW